MTKIIDRKIIRVEIHQNGAHRVTFYNDDTESNVYSCDYVAPVVEKVKGKK